MRSARHANYLGGGAPEDEATKMKMEIWGFGGYGGVRFFWTYSDFVEFLKKADRYDNTHLPVRWKYPIAIAMEKKPSWRFMFRQGYGIFDGVKAVYLDQKIAAMSVASFSADRLAGNAVSESQRLWHEGDEKNSYRLMRVARAISLVREPSNEERIEEEFLNFSNYLLQKYGHIPESADVCIACELPVKISDRLCVWCGDDMLVGLEEERIV